MKILKKGNPPAARVWRGECHRCHCVVEATQDELPVVKIEYDPRKRVEFCWMPCPECGAGNGEEGFSVGYGGVLFYPAKEGA